jgi:predicted outer membrane repeat protein
MLLSTSIEGTSYATIWYSASAPQGNNDCTTWGNTCLLKDALMKAQSGDQIWVKAGVHYPSTGDRTEAFILWQGVRVYGGFSGTETSLEQRDWLNNKTILSGDIDKNDINTDGNLIAETTSDIQGSNSYHVLLCNVACDSSTIIDGFIITAGSADSYGGAYQSMGAGMLNFGTPTLINLIFQGNYAIGYGGAIYNVDGAGMSLTNVRFISNMAYTQSGGAIYNSPANNYTSSNLIISDVEFLSNSAGDNGGAIAGFLMNLSIRNGLFSGNSAYSSGGAISAEDSSLSIEDTIFSENIAGWEGGGIYNSDDTTLLNVKFIANTAEYGGGIYGDSITCTNSIFSRNSANTGGGFFIVSNGTLKNISMSGNIADLYGGGIAYQDDNSSDTLIVANSVLWGDLAGSGGSEIYRYSGSGIITIYYSDIHGCGGSNIWQPTCGTDGGGNIDGDPVYLDPSNDDLRVNIASPSPVIDAGNNSLVPADIKRDIDGNSRFVDILSVPDTGYGTPPLVDMGAHEAFRYKLTVIKAGAGSGIVNASGCLLNWDDPTGTCTADNTQITLTANGNQGSAFAGWSGGTGSASSCTNGICSFTITMDSSIIATFTVTAVKLLSPNGGEVIPSGSSYTIQWQAPANAHHYTLKLSMDNGMTWSTIASNITGNSYNWDVPIPWNNKRKCFIKVIAFNASNVKIGADSSDGPFTIEVIKLNTPNGGETLTSGSTYNITWTTNQTIRPVSKVILSYTLDGGVTWKAIPAIAGNPGTYSWTVPTVSTSKTKCKVKVVLKDSAGNTIGSDVSDAFFTINP